MGSFFTEIFEHELLTKAPIVFDWLFDEKKFESPAWNAKKKAKFTKSLKRLEGFGKGNFRKSEKMEKYPDVLPECGEQPIPFALFSSSNSVGQDFVRHVRNAIAHGNAEIRKVKGSYFCEFRDYQAGRKMQTAYIAIPANYLERIYKSYKDVEKERDNERPRGNN